MTSSLDYGRKILMRRMIQGLELEGYRVEFAEEYNGWIVAGQGEDPAVILIEADTIERFRADSPGNASGFIQGIVGHVKSQISAQGSSSLQPPPDAAAVDYADVPSEPPQAVEGEVADDMIVGEEPAPAPSEPPQEVEQEFAEPAQDGGVEEDQETMETPAEEPADEVSVNMDELEASSPEQEPPAGEEPAGEEEDDAGPGEDIEDEDEEKERMEQDVTEELSLEEIKE